MPNKTVQGPAIECSLGCVKRAPAARGGGQDARISRSLYYVAGRYFDFPSKLVINQRIEENSNKPL